MMSKPVVRVSILRCEPSKFVHFRDRMAEAETVLAPGIEAIKAALDISRALMKPHHRSRM
jgi:hypothetical protein